MAGWPPSCESIPSRFCVAVNAGFVKSCTNQSRVRNLPGPGSSHGPDLDCDVIGNQSRPMPTASRPDGACFGSPLPTWRRATIFSGANQARPTSAFSLTRAWASSSHGTSLGTGDLSRVPTNQSRPVLYQVPPPSIRLGRMAAAASRTAQRLRRRAHPVRGRAATQRPKSTGLDPFCPG